MIAAMTSRGVPVCEDAAPISPAHRITLSSAISSRSYVVVGQLLIGAVDVDQQVARNLRRRRSCGTGRGGGDRRVVDAHTNTRGRIRDIQWRIACSSRTSTHDLHANVRRRRTGLSVDIGAIGVGDTTRALVVDIKAVQAGDRAARTY